MAFAGFFQSERDCLWQNIAWATYSLQISFDESLSPYRMRRISQRFYLGCLDGVFHSCLIVAFGRLALFICSVTPKIVAFSGLLTRVPITGFFHPDLFFSSSGCLGLILKNPIVGFPWFGNQCSVSVVGTYVEVWGVAQHRSCLRGMLSLHAEMLVSPNATNEAA